MTDVIIREATESDIPAVVELSMMIVKLHVANLPLFTDDLKNLEEDYRKALTDDKKMLLVAESDAKVVGYSLLSFKTNPEFFQSRYREVLEVEEIGVNENYRRHGIARKLETEVEKIAHAGKINLLLANVYDFNQASQKLHENSGYKVLSRKYWKDLSNDKEEK
ncbi:GNAT family N-acetyltransferase [Candidatus Saccharibacteria bacterium]|nr:GNAT family N-acetyltransferase [Candidatus Saccharibacteria bacterium]